MDKSAEIGGWDRAIASRRRALALMVGAGGWCTRAIRAADGGGPLRLAISESMVGDVNLTDARAAMLVWVQRIASEISTVVEYNPKIFETSQEILTRVRTGRLEAVALNVVEYRQVADLLDAGEVVAEAGAAGPERYVLLVKQDSGIQNLGDLKKRRLSVLKTAKMCVAGAWLSTLLDEGRHGESEQFFSSVTSEGKVSRVVLPVFFGQTDACLTTKRGFDTMCALNPQVGRDLKTLAVSPAMVVTFYVFRKSYHSPARESFLKVLMDLHKNAAGRQIATMFQFEELAVRDASCLAPALTVLDAAERINARRGGGGRKGV